jgi:hypothetical protein
VPVTVSMCLIHGTVCAFEFALLALAMVNDIRCRLSSCTRSSWGCCAQIHWCELGAGRYLFKLLLD